MIKPFGAVKGFGVGNNSACSLDSAFEVVKKLNEVIEHINTAEEPAKEPVKENINVGFWADASGGRTICNRCGNYPLYDYHGQQKFSNYCPNCGAKMEGVKNG